VAAMPSGFVKRVDDRITAKICGSVCALWQHATLYFYGRSWLCINRTDLYVMYGIIDFLTPRNVLRWALWEICSTEVK